MGRRQSALLLLTALPLLGCNRDKLVVGVDAQPAIVSRIGKVRVNVTVSGKTIAEREIVPKNGDTPFPFEVKLDGKAGTDAEVTVEAFSAGPNDTVASTPMLVRRSRAPFVRGAPKLVRLRLESSCVTGTIGFKGPTCPPPQSCSAGRCIDPTLLPEDLEAYAADWQKSRPDACKSARGGALALTVGTGQTDFVTLVPGQTLTPEKGPQGGHHLWMAVRTHDLPQTGSKVTLSAEQPGTGLKVPPTSFVFSLEPDVDGACKLYGLRLQIDNSSVPVADFLGKPLDVSVAVLDVNGAHAEEHVRVNVAANTIGD